MKILLQISLKISLSVLLFGFLFAAVFAADKPNIVIFLADDLGWADVGWHADSATTGKIETPHLDKLASQGIRFEQFYVQPLCTPTRAALMTGRYPIRYGLQSGVIFPWADYGLSTDEQTLPQALHDAGYYTAIIGKWHLGSTENKYKPLQRGFDYHYGFYQGMIDYYAHTNPSFGGLDWHRNGKSIAEEGYSTKLIADEAVKIIQHHNTEQPLFLYVPFNAVHSPYQEIQNQKLKQQYTHLKEQRKIYAGMVSSMDSNIGRIHQALKDKGISDNTLIFFSSDNGGPKPKEVTDNGHLRGAKGGVWEGGVRVPAFAVWSGKIKPNTVSQQLIHITDLYPTLLNIADAKFEQEKSLDGFDLTDVLLNDKPHQRTEILLNADEKDGAVRSGDWKLIAVHRRKEEPPFFKNFLYNLKDDPGETTDLAKEQPEKVQELLEKYEKYVREAVPALLKPKPADFKAPAVWGEFN